MPEIPSSSPTLAFIGLGVMGYPMAGHLARAGYNITVHNRTASRAEQWCGEYRSRSAATPAQAVANADIVMLCVGRDEDVRAVVSGQDGIAGSLKPQAIVIDHSTTSAGLAREMAAFLHGKQASFIDAPVSGGEQGAINGQLTILCGGDEGAYARVEPILKAYARTTTYLGPSGSGQLAKMVNQICIAGLLQGLAEGIHFGQQAGLDMPKVMAAISQGAAQSWQLQNRAQTMLNDQYDFGFAVEWMRKDLGYCLNEAEKLQASLPVAEMVDGFYARLEAMGGARWDTSSLLRALQKPSA